MSTPRAATPRRRQQRSGMLLTLMLVLLVLAADARIPNRRTASPHMFEEEKTGAPIIGIFAQPSHDAAPGACDGRCEYVAASYVKWAEAAGARALPIPYNATAPVLDALFERVNGLLLPGGGNPLPDAAVHMLGRALAAHEAGGYFPVWATCLGMEWLMQALGGEGFELDATLDAWNISLPLQFTPEARQSRLFRGMDPSLFAAAGSEPLAMNNHHKGAAPAQFLHDPRLAATFTILSTNVDRGGRPFVSTIEGRGGLPVWAVQWHPEKNIFEWGTVPDPATGRPLAYEAVNHSPDAQALTRYMAEFFVSHTRRNAHRFPTQAEEAAALFYNYAAVASGPEFVQKYYFRGYPAYDVYERGGGGSVSEAR